MTDQPKKRRLSTATLVFFLALFGFMSILMLATRPPKEVVPWRTDIDKARVESRDTGKPLLLYFTAKWCPPCRQMSRTTWADQKVADALNSVVPLKIDIDEYKDVAISYQINAVPTLVLEKSADVSSRREGLITTGQLLEWLRE